jgi:hypothetical protein
MAQYGLKNQAHQAICQEMVASKARSLDCSAQSLRFGLRAVRQHQAAKRKDVLHTVRPAVLTTSVYFSPSTVDPSLKDSGNILESSCAVEIASGSYCLCPEHCSSIHISARVRRDRCFRYQSPLYRAEAPSVALNQHAGRSYQ